MTRLGAKNTCNRATSIVSPVRLLLYDCYYTIINVVRRQRMYYGSVLYYNLTNPRFNNGGFEQRPVEFRSLSAPPEEVILLSLSCVYTYTHWVWGILFGRPLLNLGSDLSKQSSPSATPGRWRVWNGLIGYRTAPHGRPAAYRYNKLKTISLTVREMFSFNFSGRVNFVRYLPAGRK